MKTRLLPDTDLARIAPLEKSAKLIALRQLKLGHIPYSYNPTRRVSSDAMNIQPGPLGHVGRVPWVKVAEQIVRDSRSDAEEQANLSVAKALYDLTDEDGLSGRRHEFFPLALGLSHKVSYWVSAVLSRGGVPIVPFIDPRRSKKLTSQGRRFAFSVMHQRIRVSDPDFADVELAIIQFRGVRGSQRFPELHLAGTSELYDFEQLDVMVRETYEVWNEVLNEREHDTRKRAGGVRGSLI